MNAERALAAAAVLVAQATVEATMESRKHREALRTAIRAAAQQRRAEPVTWSPDHPTIIFPDSIRRLNRERCDRWHPPTGDDWTLGDWSNAFMGEAGELANVVKKLRRHQSGHATSYNTPEADELRGRFAEEVADVLLYLDLLAWKAGIEPDHLLGALRSKFNLVSRAQGWDDLTVWDGR